MKVKVFRESRDRLRCRLYRLDLVSRVYLFSFKWFYVWLAVERSSYEKRGSYTN